MSKLTFILGGARSGKSSFAQRLAGAYPKVTYLATGRVLDDEMADRVARHRADRPAAWQTVEEGYHPAAALAAAWPDPRTDAHANAPAGSPGSVVLLDCVSFLVANHLLQEEAGCEKRVMAELDAICRLPVDLIAVSNEVGMGVVPEYKLGRLYRDILGRANQYLAAQASQVYVCWAGIPVDIKRLGQALEGERL